VNDDEQERKCPQSWARSAGACDLTLVGKNAIPQQRRTDNNIYMNDWEQTTVFYHVTYRDDPYNTAYNLLLQ